MRENAMPNFGCNINRNLHFVKTFWECHTEDGWKNVLSHNQALISVK